VGLSIYVPPLEKVPWGVGLRRQMLDGSKNGVYIIFKNPEGQTPFQIE